MPPPPHSGILGPSFPEGFRLSFPTRTNYMYAVVKHSLPALRAFTVCLWLRPAEGGIGTPLSYAVPSQPNELVLLQGLHTPTELLVNDKVPPPPPREKFARLCSHAFIGFVLLSE